MNAGRSIGAWWFARRGDNGASFIEYAFLLTLIVLFCLAAMTVLGDDTHDGMSNSASTIAEINT